jgi:hypothetical protein
LKNFHLLFLWISSYSFSPVQEYFPPRCRRKSAKPSTFRNRIYNRESLVYGNYILYVEAISTVIQLTCCSYLLLGNGCDKLAKNVRKCRNKCHIYIYISKYKTGRFRTLFPGWYLFYSSFTFEATTCFGCTLNQPSSGGVKTKELVTQISFSYLYKNFFCFSP